MNGVFLTSYLPFSQNEALHPTLYNIKKYVFENIFHNEQRGYGERHFDLII